MAITPLLSEVKAVHLFEIYANTGREQEARYVDLHTAMFYQFLRASLLLKRVGVILKGLNTSLAT